MYLLMHCCFIILLSFVPGCHAQSVMVANATTYVGDNATMMFTFIPAEGQTLSFVSWYKCVGGVINGTVIISNFSGNPAPNGKYSLDSDGQLHISAVEHREEGCYLCTVATLPLGTTADGFAYLTVKYTVPTTIDEKTVSETSTTKVPPDVDPHIAAIILIVFGCISLLSGVTICICIRCDCLPAEWKQTELICFVIGSFLFPEGFILLYGPVDVAAIILLVTGCILIVAGGILFFCYIFDKCKELKGCDCCKCLVDVHFVLGVAFLVASLPLIIVGGIYVHKTM